MNAYDAILKIFKGRKGTLTSATLVEKTGFSSNTVRNVLNEMFEAGTIIFKGHEETGTRGRPRALYARA